MSLEFGIFPVSCKAALRQSVDRPEFRTGLARSEMQVLEQGGGNGGRGLLGTSTSWQGWAVE